QSLTVSRCLKPPTMRTYRRNGNAWPCVRELRSALRCRIRVTCAVPGDTLSEAYSGRPVPPIRHLSCVHCGGRLSASSLAGIRSGGPSGGGGTLEHVAECRGSASARRGDPAHRRDERPTG